LAILGRAILAFGRSDGTVSLMSLYDSLLPRFEVQQPCPVACVAWRPTVALRPSKNPRTPGVLVKTEDLLVGDEVGNIYYYSVEWPDMWEVSRDGYSGSMRLLARISVHTQQVCGLSFSRDGSLLATGGNDNLCCLFDTYRILENTEKVTEAEESSVVGPDGTRRTHVAAGSNNIKEITTGAERHRWIHGAAVKAIAFCPWRNGTCNLGRAFL
jgi:meiosis-specific APC/C activator protein AMA1